MKKIVLKISKILIVALTAVILLLFLFNFNILVEPKNNTHTYSRIIVFKWSGNSDLILIDDNPQFNSPIVLKGNGVAITELEPGNYFWKTFGIGITRKFTIDSAVILKHSEGRIKNEGNTNLLLELFNNLALTGMSFLNINQEINISNVTEIIASQK